MALPEQGRLFLLVGTAALVEIGAEARADAHAGPVALEDDGRPDEVTGLS